MSKAIIFGGFVFSLLVGSGIGYAVRDHFADRAAKAEASAEIKATADAAEGVRDIEAKTLAAIEQAASNYEDLRAAIEAKAASTPAKVREIYRDVKVPADCAVPAIGRSLLITLGAGADAASRDASAARSPQR